MRTLRQNMLMKVGFSLKKLPSYFVPAILLLYLAYNALHGKQGLIGGAVEDYRQQRLSSEISKVRQERVRLEHNISLISGEQIDVDLLDELARRELPLIAKNQIILTK
jgi:cell division protein FtsB